MSKPDIKDLFAAGAHFGHKSSRWHPSMKPYIHSKRDGVHVIDLAQTVEAVETSMQVVEKVAAAGKPVLFVGTKVQLQNAVKEAATRVSMPYVTERWLGGMLTNTNTVNVRIKRLKELESKMASGELASRYNKLEVQRYQEEIDLMNKKFGGIKELNGKPGLVVIVDVPGDLNAVLEARKLNIPIIGICDTNADPNLIDYIIPANDDSLKAVVMILSHLCDAVESGKAKKTVEAPKEEAEAPAAKE